MDNILVDIGIRLDAFVRAIFFNIIKVLVDMTYALSESLLDGVVGFSDIALKSAYIQDAYTGCLVIFWLILPVKLSYEILTSMVENEEVEIDKKLMATMKAAIIATTLQIAIITILNPIAVEITKILAGGDSTTFAENISVAVFTSFGGMPETNNLFVDQTDENGKPIYGMDLGARQFVKNIANYDEALKGNYSDGEDSGEGYDEYHRSTNSFDSAERWGLYHWWDAYDDGNTCDGDLYKEYGIHDDKAQPRSNDKDILDQRKSLIETKEYKLVWEYSDFGVLFGFVVTVFLLFFIAIEMATRSFVFAFCFAVGPICCLSLTNIRQGQEAQAFKIWKQTIIGNWFINSAQIFSFIMFFNIIDDISTYITNSGMSSAAGTTTRIILFWAALGFVISVPAYVKSMIGGYGAGALETAQAIKGMMTGASTMSGLSAARKAVQIGKATSRAGKKAYRGGQKLGDLLRKRRTGGKGDSGQVPGGNSNTRNKNGNYQTIDRNGSNDLSEPINSNVDLKTGESVQDTRNRKAPPPNGFQFSEGIDEGGNGKNPVDKNTDSVRDTRTRGTVPGNLRNSDSMDTQKGDYNTTGMVEPNNNNTNAKSRNNSMNNQNGSITVNGTEYSDVWANQLKSRTSKQLERDRYTNIRKRKNERGDR